MMQLCRVRNQRVTIVTTMKQEKEHSKFLNISPFGRSSSNSLIVVFESLCLMSRKEIKYSDTWDGPYGMYRISNKEGLHNVFSFVQFFFLSVSKYLKLTV